MESQNFEIKVTYEMLQRQVERLKDLLKEHEDMERRIFSLLKELDSESSHIERLRCGYQRNCKEYRQEIEDRLNQLVQANMTYVYASPDFMRSRISELKS